MPDSIEIQQGFNKVANPCATRARHHSDYEKPIMEAHFKELESMRNRKYQHEPGHIASPRAGGLHQDLSQGWDSQDINHAFTSYFK